MGLLSFFGSAQVNFKMARRKTFSTATTEMRVSTIVFALGVRPAVNILPEQNTAMRLPIIPNHSVRIPDPSYSEEMPAFSSPEDPI
jgi:hypothetical protein